MFTFFSKLLYNFYGGIMDFLKNIKNKTLIIVEDNLKNKILEMIDKQNKLINLKILTITEFYKRYFFDYNKETLYYLNKNYNLSVSNSKMYLDNIKYVINKESDNQNIIKLQKMYQDLKNNNLLIFDNLFKTYLKSFDLIVLNKDSLEPFIINILEEFNPTYYDLETKDYGDIPVYEFKTIEEEVAFVFNQISSLLKKGINQKNIKLMNVTSEYQSFLRRFSFLYNIKISDIEKTSIYATTITKEVLEKIKNKSSKEEILSYLDKYKDKDIYMQIFNILNQFYFLDDLNSAYSLIVDDFKNTYLKEPKYLEEIQILPVNSYLVNEDDYVFLMGFNLENIPKTYKDIDYLNDSLKKELGLFTSLEKNKLEHNCVLKHIKNINNLTITLKLVDPYNTYYPSNLLEELEIIKKNTSNINTTSNLYNKIKLTNNLDLMLKYGTKLDDTTTLFNTYQDISYMTYDNTFKGLKNYSSKNINLSYSSLNNYYHCKFRYYIDNILKLNIYEDTFKIYIGNLFHFVLSKIFEPNFDFDYTYNEFLKDKEFSKKELFYLTILKEELKDLINIILNQHSLSGLNKVKLESTINIKFDNDNFKGIIDKIMYKEKDNNTYISLIDYKTGNPSLDMSNLQYGIDMQLPIYVYLVKKSKMFTNPQIIGFYFQKILHEKLSYDSKKTFDEANLDNLKLMGYSINDPYLVSMFDSSYENSQMIKGMKITSKGFAHYSKVLSEDAINNLVDIVDLKIQEAFKSIKEGNFNINPKVIKGENIVCSFCSYKDLCFKTGKDLVYLEGNDDLSYLEGGENA